ncbi:hypothetical protein [Shewanella sediminis]|uniref:hypothetical protein n=1 Tax=Shewanella sediminis TaxID=271097 RepID=UPI00059E7549|nr:hypothetical protein [Shewanella sediminis]
MRVHQPFATRYFKGATIFGSKLTIGQQLHSRFVVVDIELVRLAIERERQYSYTHRRGVASFVINSLDGYSVLQ